ncbi:nucleolar protein 11-like [Saccoglossus kowalevskii]
MATLMEGFELCPLSNENDLLGITEDNKQDSRVIVTNRRGVTIYKVSHQKPLHSWSTKASLSFTCPVVLNHTTLEYIAVQNHKKDLFLLHHCFLRISDISEEYLVKCLQLYLSIKEDGPFDAVMDQIKINEMIKKLPVLLSECPIHPCKAFYINQILLCPCNDVFIVDYLRKLTVEQSMIFLEYLHFLLMKTPVCRKKPTKFPAFERTVEWICMILDAQFTQLLIFPDARDLLLQLHETVADKMVFFKELGSVELLLNQLKQRTELPSTQRKKDDTTLYRIEILKLKI